MNNLEHKRHSLAHLLSAAVLKLYPDAKNAIGPAVENGFYYDFEFSTTISEKDFPRIEKEMKKTLKSWKGFESQETTANEARKRFADNTYKLELIDEIVEKGEKITLYTSGDFTDLCRGGHTENPSKEIIDGSFMLDRVAGAYWRGDEKNKMLTRIYGLAFDTKEELDSYIAQREEAKKRDHKKIGKEMGLFTFSELIGAGLPLWTPKGTIMRELLNDFVWDLRKSRGYQKVTIPHITKKALYETSGHWSKFSEELFKVDTREGHQYAMKPMNCPHHTQIFDSAPKSYRDMPQRYCETTMVYRDEQSGELSGLSRVLSITQDDAHVFCRENQAEEEIFSVWDIIDRFYSVFGFKDIKVRISKHDPKNFDKYLGTPEIWAKAEKTLTELVEKRGVKDWIDGVGEAAMYGPKIDFISKDSIGRSLQVATIQLDYNMPNNFKLQCTNEKGEREPVVMIHCAIMGSIERFMSTLIEHYAGNFPLWLSPVQVKIIPIMPAHNKYARGVFEALKNSGIRAEFADTDENLGKKIRAGKIDKIPYMVIIGDKEKESDTVTLESRDNGNLGTMTAIELLTKITKEIQEKK
jgi:threonyl-tRNA synthetase